jgi:hypothetical protein
MRSRIALVTSTGDNLRERMAPAMSVAGMKARSSEGKTTPPYR